MGFSNNPLVPWRELDKALSWGKHGDLTLRKPAAPPPSPPSSSPIPPPPEPRLVRRAPAAVRYAELHAHSDFSFLDGASEPDALVAEAARLGLEALAVTDHDGLYGAARFASAAEGTGVGTVFGAELSLSAAQVERTGAFDPAGGHLLLLARDLEGYRALSKAIGDSHLRGRGKGRPVYDLEDLAGRAAGRWVALTGCRKGAVRRALASGGTAAAGRELDRLRALFGRDNVYVELTDHDLPDDDARNDALARLAERHRAATIATNNVHYAAPDDWKTATALAALRARRTLDEMAGWFPGGPTAHLRSGEEMAARFARFPGILERTVELASACVLDFATVKPRLPTWPVPDGRTEAEWLRGLVEAGALERYGARGDNARAWAQIDHEMGVIGNEQFPGYFLIVHDIVKFCYEHGILCQGRGSAANSAVCYALRITNVDPIEHKLLFERFLSPERDGYPDIDLDIESKRREEVIQYVYGKYGRDRAAQVANVISYRTRMAVRDAARVLGYAVGAQDAWSKQLGPYAGVPDAVDAEIPADVLELAERLHRLPRHLGIHSGGMVICDRPVAQVVPTEWARMADRSVLQWDKDDCADADLVKFDLLGLGMLGALHDAFDLVAEHHGRTLTLGTVPEEDPEVYAMLGEADSVGVFQVESRAQMATLPRLKPKEFYDLVIEVALIRPGPIQGGAVHPYMRRRSGQEDPDPPVEILRPVLKRTLGIPLFQEQVMQMAVVAAGFTPADADRLRRAMSSKRFDERISQLREKLLKGMAENGIVGETAEDIYRKLEAFSSYGFPESHSISFAYLVYISSYLKRYYPAAFCAALLNNQPMGFYSPMTLVDDARRHDVRVLGPDVNASRAGAGLERATGPYRPRHRFASPFPQPALRTGLDSVRDLGGAAAERIVEERERGGAYQDLEDFVRRARPARAALEALATAGAFGCFGLSRREALWQAGVLAEAGPDQLPGVCGAQRVPPLPAMTAVEQTFADLWATGSSPDSHPIGHLRARLADAGCVTAAQLAGLPDGRYVRIAGIVTHRQRPPTAGGVCFLSLEDETGLVNIVCPPPLWEREKRVALAHGALLITGTLERSERDGGAVNVVAGRLAPLRVAAQPGRVRGRDFR